MLAVGYCQEECTGHRPRPRNHDIKQLDQSLFTHHLDGELQ